MHRLMTGLFADVPVVVLVPGGAAGSGGSGGDSPTTTSTPTTMTSQPASTPSSAPVASPSSPVPAPAPRGWLPTTGIEALLVPVALATAGVGLALRGVHR